ADLLLLAALAGSSHYLIGALSIVNGLLSWARPDHHAFHGAVGTLLALASFTTSNFGGFLLGMLLGVIGGSLVLAWSADPRQGGRGGADAPAGRARGGWSARLRSAVRRSSRRLSARTRRDRPAHSADWLLRRW
ncbi:DUF6114 domain-containing protein, partial [Nocardiopsis lucentensis]|uniref:DUF6114 domain-containing protein n=1 Tax=Nocardiopsis lucentensis TaxID=53441 RepID=UPI001F4CA6A3